MIDKPKHNHLPRLQDAQTRILLALIAFMVLSAVLLYAYPLNSISTLEITATRYVPASTLQATTTAIAQVGLTQTVAAVPRATAAREVSEGCTGITLLDEEAQAISASLAGIEEVVSVVVEANCGIGLSGAPAFRQITLAFDLGEMTFEEAATELFPEIAPVLEISDTPDVISLVLTSAIDGNRVLNNIYLNDFVRVASSQLPAARLWAGIQALAQE